MKPDAMQAYLLAENPPGTIDQETEWEPLGLGHPLRLGPAVHFFRMQPHGNMATFYFKLCDAGILAGISTDLIILRFLSFLKKDRREKLYAHEFLRGITGDMNRTDLAMLYKRMQPSLPPRNHADIEENPDVDPPEPPKSAAPQPCVVQKPGTPTTVTKTTSSKPTLTREEFLAMVPSGSMSAFYFRLFAKGPLAGIDTDEIALRFLQFFAESERLYIANEKFIHTGMTKPQISALWKLLAVELPSCTPISPTTKDPLSPGFPPAPVAIAPTPPTASYKSLLIATTPEPVLITPEPVLIAQAPQAVQDYASEPLLDFTPSQETLVASAPESILNFTSEPFLDFQSLLDFSPSLDASAPQTLLSQLESGFLNTDFAEVGCIDPACVDTTCKDAGCVKATCGEPSCVEAASTDASCALDGCVGEGCQDEVAAACKEASCKESCCDAPAESAGTSCVDCSGLDCKDKTCNAICCSGGSYSKASSASAILELEGCVIEECTGKGCVDAACKEEAGCPKSGCGETKAPKVSRSASSSPTKSDNRKSSKSAGSSPTPAKDQIAVSLLAPPTTLVLTPESESTIVPTMLTSPHVTLISSPVSPMSAGSSLVHSPTTSEHDEVHIIT